MVGLGLAPTCEPFVVAAGRHKSYVTQQDNGQLNFFNETVLIMWL